MHIETRKTLSVFVTSFVPWYRTGVASYYTVSVIVEFCYTAAI